jgi:2-aminoadipate transaminase
MDPRVTELHRRAAARPGVIPLAGGLPADELLPSAALSAVVAEAALHRDALQYGWPEGLPAVRSWIAARLVARGACVDADHVIVTAGAQQALALVAAELPRGTRIAVGRATYPAALSAFADHAIVEHGNADATYVIAGASNPQGVDLLGDALPDGELIVDEAYAELRFDGRVPPPVALRAPHRVWHVGTVSKTLCPGLRIGWLVPPTHRRAFVLERKLAADLQTASLTQVAFARLLEVIDYDGMLVSARRRYAARADRLCSALRRYAPDVRFLDPEGGFSIWVETDDAGDDIDLLAAAIDAGVSLDPGRLFTPAARETVAFRLSFSHAAADALEEGARRIATALRRWRT